MTALVPIAVRFQNGAAVPLDRVFAVADAYEGDHGYLSPREVIWEDGSFSYAKGWWFSLDDGRLCRVGAGAYGDAVVLERRR